MPPPCPASKRAPNPKAKVPREWVRGPADLLAVEQGCWFDRAAGERVCRFIETFCRQSKGRWAGQPLRLLDWQRDFLMRLFGWKRADGTRRYRTAYLEVAKKNGKSTLLSAIAVYLTVADAEGQKQWARLAPVLDRMGVLKAVDGDALALYCDHYSRWVEATAAVRKEGLLTVCGTGGLKCNPAVGIAAAAMAAMLKILAEFGCTPSSRSRVRVETDGPKDDLAEFLGK